MAHEPIMPPTHPGKFLRLEFLEPLGMTDEQLADELGVPPAEITELTGERRGITTDLGVRLSRHFGLSDGFWIRLQRHYDSEMAKDRAAGVHYGAEQPPGR